MSEGLPNGSRVIRRWMKWTAVGLGCAALGLALLALAVQAGYFNAALIRLLEARTGRQIRVEGPLHVHVLTLDPRLIGERVTIGNPPWMPPGIMAQAGQISLTFAVPRPGHWFGIEGLEMKSAVLHLSRDSSGRANWQQTDPNKEAGKGMSLIRSLSIPRAHVLLDDARQHLQFDGTVSAGQADGAGKVLRIVGNGELNGRSADFEITGDALASASHDSPYHFTFTERGSGTRISGRGFLPRPFDFKVLDTKFDAAGEDLKDLYFLTGVSLVNTGPYRLSGTLARRGPVSQFTDLAVTSGQSDMHGTVSIDRSSGRRKIDAEVASQVLRIADLGLRAAGRAPQSEGGIALLLPDAQLNAAALRGGDAVVSLRARRVEVGRVPLSAVAARITVEHGILRVAPLSADVLEGKLSAHLKIDANADPPAADLDLKIADLQLAQVAQLVHPSAEAPLVEGLMRARINVTGRGSSAHQIAASANGTVTAVVPRGTVRDSLAELAGLDLRGLGLMLTKKSQDTTIRCGVASFQARSGELTAQSVVMDTEPVLVTGSGTVRLDSESLDLTFRGQPKTLRLLRLRSPVLLRGTLRHPAFAMQSRNAAGQVAAAVALGVVLTPLASVLAFVDPGLTKDADCAAMISAADVHGATR